MLPLFITIVKHQLTIIAILEADSLLFWNNPCHRMIPLRDKHGRSELELGWFVEFKAHGEGDGLFGVGSVEVEVALFVD